MGIGMSKKKKKSLAEQMALYGVLFKGVNVRDAVEDLMSRDKRSEMDDIVDILSSTK